MSMRQVPGTPRMMPKELHTKTFSLLLASIETVKRNQWMSLMHRTARRLLISRDRVKIPS